MTDSEYGELLALLAVVSHVHVPASLSARCEAF
jgi:hypothetical protein